MNDDDGIAGGSPQSEDELADEKRARLLDLLDRGLVMLHLDPRLPDVAVPEQFRGMPTLRLNIAYGFNLPILDIDERGVRAMLSFNRVNFDCFIPWRALFALTAPDAGHDGMVWPDSAPPELRAQLGPVAASAGGQPLAAAAPAPRPARPRLVVHEGGRLGEPEASHPAAEGDAGEAGSGVAGHAPAQAAEPAQPGQAVQPAKAGPTSHEGDAPIGPASEGSGEATPPRPSTRPTLRLVKG